MRHGTINIIYVSIIVYIFKIFFAKNIKKQELSVSESNKFIRALFLCNGSKQHDDWTDILENVQQLTEKLIDIHTYLCLYAGRITSFPLFGI